MDYVFSDLGKGQRDWLIDLLDDGRRFLLIVDVTCMFRGRSRWMTEALIPITGVSIGFPQLVSRYRMPVVESWSRTACNLIAGRYYRLET